MSNPEWKFKLKFFSRKFLLPLIFAIINIADSAYKLNLDMEIIGGLFALFIGGETVIDTVNLIKNKSRINGELKNGNRPEK